MNLRDSSGESSSKRQENGDASTGSERPLKKARFAWQVKGKYHLRNETNDLNKPSAVLTSDSEGAGSSSESIISSNGLVGNTEQNLEILGDYLLKQDFNTLDSVITDPDKSLLTPSVSVTADTMSYPRYVSSFDNNSNNAFIRSSNNDDHVLIPPSMITSHSYNEDQCIARWQARQMAKGFVDNTINRVLDSWIHPPLPPDMDNSRFLALDVAEFINNLPGDNSIENEGILMAISAHGLQNTSSSSSNNSQIADQKYNSNDKDQTFLSPPSSPMQSDDEALPEESSDKQTHVEIPSPDLSWSYSGDTKKSLDGDLIPFSLFPDSSNSYQYFNETAHLQTSNVDYDGESAGNHYDFIDAAVSFAIQNKGLTTFGTDYG